MQTPSKSGFSLKKGYKLLFDLMTSPKVPQLSEKEQREGFASLIRAFGRMQKNDQNQLIQSIRTADDKVFEGVVLKYAPDDDNVTNLPRSGKA